MTFQKTAKISLTRLATANLNSDGSIAFEKVASGPRSYFDGPGKIDIGAILQTVADEYNISKDPSDYIYEAVRAVTAEVPNENGDAFPRAELLRFDHNLKMPIYATFIGKPHQINHKTDNPKTARGVILAAHYHDDSKPKEICPSCGTKIASVEDLDNTSLGCKKCGTVVKDEFVELLLAVDKKKDPIFADAVKRGSLNGLSMGCLAGYTDCSICGHRARNANQFCSHIKAGNKKKMFKTASGLKMAYEKCGEVIFTEISRVDQPADPTALQREILTIKSASFEEETKALIAATAVNRYRFLRKSAQAKDNEVEQAKNDATEALDSIKDVSKELYESLSKQLGDTLDSSNTDNEPSDKKVNNNASDAEVSTISEYASSLEDDASYTKTPQEIGIVTDAKPVGSNKDMVPNNTKTGTIKQYIANKLDELEQSEESNKMIFANSYRSISASVTNAGNVSVATPHGRIFVIKPAQKPVGKKASAELARSVLASIANDGLVSTMMKYDAIVAPRFAQVLEHYMSDMAGDDRGDNNRPAVDMGTDLNDMADKRKEHDSSTLDSDESDHAETRSDAPSDALDGHDSDSADKYEPKKNLTDEDVSDMAEERGVKIKDTLEDSHSDGVLKSASQTKMDLSNMDIKARGWTHAMIHNALKSGHLVVDGNTVVNPKTKTVVAKWHNVPPPMSEIAEDLDRAKADQELADLSDYLLQQIDQGGGFTFLAQQDMPADMPGGGMEMMATKMKDACGKMATMCKSMSDEHPMKKMADDFMKMAEEFVAMLEKHGPDSKSSDGESAKKEASKHASRLERVYRSRFASLKAESASKVAEIKRNAINEASEKLARTMRLAAKRQALNLEESPLKVAMFDVLTSQFDLDSDTAYPGMDDFTASVVIEKVASASFDEFADKLVSRAMKFASMTPEALAQVEDDVNSILPAPVVAVAKPPSNRTAGLRGSISDGNLPFNPAPVDTNITNNLPDDNNRNSIREALGRTRVASSSKNIKKV